MADVRSALNQNRNCEERSTKTLQVIAPGKSVVVDVPTPEPGPNQVVLRVDAVTTCPQWDLHLRHDEPMFVGHKFHYPYTLGQPGHEATGVIAAVGSDVQNVAVGDRVSAWRDPGHGPAGCYAQYALLEADHVIAVPPELPATATASLELAMCVGAAFLVLKSMDAIRDRRFAVVGLGPAGLIALQMAKAEGAREVIGFDVAEKRRELALTIGADATYDPRTAPADQFPARPARPSIDCGIDCVGAKASVEWLMDHTLDVAALFGVQREPYTFDLRHYIGLRLCGYPGHSKEAARYATDLIGSGKLHLEPLITHELPLERYDEGIALLERQEAIKICFRPWE